MAHLSKNALNQIMFVLVDKTDFASIESGVTSGITVQFFGVNHGLSGAAGAATSGTISKAASLVHSGIWRQTVEAAECNYDYVIYRITHASCADQVLAFQTFSASMTSDIASAVWAHGKGTSTLAYGKVAASGASLIPTMSDILSKVYVAQTSQYAKISNYLSNASNYLSNMSNYLSGMSNILSAVYVDTADISNVASGVSNILSAVYVDTADISNILSKVNSVAQSTIKSKLSGISDILSKVYVDTADISNYLSGMSNILSAVYVDTTDISNVLSKVNSVVQSTLKSRTSDIASQVWKGDIGDNAAASTFGSLFGRVESLIGAGPAATITDSDISNIASAVWKADYSVLGAAASSFGSLVNVLKSKVGVINSASNIASAVWYQNYTTHGATGNTFGSLVTLRMSTISDIYSALAVTATASDVASAVWAQEYGTHSTASTFGSAFEKMYSHISNASDILSKVYAAQTSQYAKVSNYLSNASNYLSGASDIISKVYAAQTSQYAKISNYLSNASNYLSGASDIISKVYAAQTSQYAKVSNYLSNASNYLSNMSNYLSNASGYLSAMGAQVSDAQSAAATAASVVALYSTAIADLNSQAASNYSLLKSNLNSVIYSDLGSMIKIAQSAASDAASRTSILVVRVPGVVATSDYLSDVMSKLSNYISDVDSKISNYISDVDSKLSNYISGLDKGMSNYVSGLDKGMSNYISNVYSGLHSYLSTTGPTLKGSVVSTLSGYIAAGPAAADTTSIAKAVWNLKYSDYLTASTFGSRVHAVSVFDSNIQSYLSDLISKAQSSIESHVSGITATVDNTSIASAVWAHAKATSTLSYGKVAASGASLVPGMSDILSKVYVQTTSMASQTSNANSYLHSTVTSKLSGMSDILSKTYALSSDIGSKLGDASWLSDLSSRTAAQVWNTKYTAHSAVSTFGSLMSDVYSAAFAGALTSDAMSDIAVEVWKHASGSNVVSRVSDLVSVVNYISNIVSDISSRITSIGVGLNESALSDIGSVIDAKLDTAYTDATSLNANGIKERLRAAGWILRNKLKVGSAGDTQMFKDDDLTEAFSVASQLTSDVNSVVRKRYA